MLTANSRFKGANPGMHTLRSGVSEATRQSSGEEEEKVRCIDERYAAPMFVTYYRRLPRDGARGV